jgi:hypothetical protein
MENKGSGPPTGARTQRSSANPVVGRSLPSGNTTLPKTPRFEQTIELKCCDTVARLVGNLSLRGAGATQTRLGYECKICRRQLQVVDDWGLPSPETLAEIDATE